LLKYLVLSFYRITILLDDDKVIQGIREYANSNIDYVTNLYRAKASKEYGKKLVDVEAAMLSKNSTAVKMHLEEKLKKIKKQKEYKDTPIQKSYNRKKGSSNKPTFEERTKKDNQ
jgi:hypothetical protein